MCIDTYLYDKSDGTQQAPFWTANLRAVSLSPAREILRRSLKLFWTALKGDEKVADP
jgi:hypothetical protein